MAANASIILQLVDKATAGLKNVEKQIGGIEKSVNKSNASLDKMSSTVKKVGGAIATAFAAKGIGAAAASFEDLQDSLTAVFGSLEAGATAFDFITEYAQSTQFSVQDLTETLIKLKANGVDPANYGLSSTAELLTLFTDAAAITTDQIGSLQAITDLFARTTAGGLGLEDLNRLADRGVPVFSILNDTLGLTRLEISEVGKSAEGSRIILEALARGINKDFGGATAGRMDNLSTAMSNFGVAMDLASAGFVSKLQPALSGVINGASRLITALEPVTVILGTVLTGILTVVEGALNGIAFVLEGFAEHWQYLAQAILMVSAPLLSFAKNIGTTVPIVGGLITVLSRLNPWVTGITIAFAAVGVIRKNWEGILTFFEGMFDKMQLGWLKVKRATYEALDALPWTDFSGSIADVSRQIDTLSAEMDAAATAVEQTANNVDNAAASTDLLTGTVVENTAVTNENSEANQDLRDQLAALENQVEKVEGAYKDYTSALQRSVELSGLDNKERAVQIELQKGLEAQASALGKTVEQLSDIERENVEEFVRGSLEKIAINEQAEESRRDFATETDRIIKQSYTSTTDAITQLRDERAKYEQQANSLGLEDSKATLDALNAYDQLISKEMVERAEERHRTVIDATKSALEDQMSSYDVYAKGVQDLQEALDDGIELSEEERYAYLKSLQDDYIDSTKSEFGNLYGFFEEKVMDFTGLSSKEFGILDDTVKLIFGQSISGTLDAVFAGGISAVQGFGNQGQQAVNVFGQTTNATMNNTGTSIAGSFGNTALNGVGTFASAGFNLISGFASNVFGALGNMGSWIGNLFSGLFSNVLGGASSLFSNVFSMFGGGGGGGAGGGIGSMIGGALGSIFGPVGTAIGSIFGGLFADGGHLPAGKFGIAGEEGPEVIKGPLDIYSNEDSMNMMGGGGTNVNITINAVDAAGIDELLSQKRSVITNMVRQALREDAAVL